MTGDGATIAAGAARPLQVPDREEFFVPETRHDGARAAVIVDAGFGGRCAGRFRGVDVRFI